MDGALPVLNQTYPLYQTLYNEYLQAFANHTITRNGEWTKTYTQAEIDAAVNMSYLTSGWYHQSPSQGDHTISARGSWSFSELAKRYKCNGSQDTEMFRTAYDAFETHRLSCKDYNTSSLSSFCSGDAWYSCDSGNWWRSDYHRVRTCTKTYTAPNGDTEPCGWEFKECTYFLVRDHNQSDWWKGKTTHSDDANNSNDDNTASNPDPPSNPSPTPSPSPSPSYHACGVHETTVLGTHESSVCGTSGHYACDGNSHGGAACSISGHYQCDSLEHVLLTCPTDSNSQDCDYSSYYSCSPHEHAYPPVDNTPNCSNCTDGCSTCQATCANGHTYDPRMGTQVNDHRTRRCRYDKCGQTWEKCGAGRPSDCNDPKRKKNGKGCWAEDI